MFFERVFVPQSPTEGGAQAGPSARALGRRAGTFRHLVRLTAETAWQRFECFTEYAQWEAQSVEAVLDEARRAAPLVPRAVRAVAHAILEVFSSDFVVLQSAARREERLRELFGKLLRKKYGRRPSFEFFIRPLESRPRGEDATGSTSSLDD